MYTLDLDTVISVLQTHFFTGILRADLPRGTAGLREAGRIEVTMVAGKAGACQIYNDQGICILQGDEAVRKIQRERLSWVPQASQVNTPAPSHAPQIPHRLMHVEASQMLSWPRFHRKVYALVDGKNTLPRIAQILAVPPATIEAALRDFQRAQLIRLD